MGMGLPRIHYGTTFWEENWGRACLVEIIEGCRIFVFETHPHMSFWSSTPTSIPLCLLGKLTESGHVPSTMLNTGKIKATVSIRLDFS